MAEFRRYRPPQQTPKGFWALLGIPCQGGALLEMVCDGFPIDVLDRLSALSGFDVQELAHICGMTTFALQKRQQMGRLSTQQSDRLFRVADVMSAAGELFEGNIGFAKRWLTSSQRGLGERRPIDMLRTRVGAEMVLDLIGRLEHGVLS